jgi:hypothetical protein
VGTALLVVPVEVLVVLVEVLVILVEVLVMLVEVLAVAVEVLVIPVELLIVPVGIIEDAVELDADPGETDDKDEGVDVVGVPIPVLVERLVSRLDVGDEGEPGVEERSEFKDVVVDALLEPYLYSSSLLPAPQYSVLSPGQRKLQSA